MNPIPLASSDDEVMVKAPDGTWKILRDGALTDVPTASTAPAQPIAPVRRAPPSAMPSTTKIPVMDIRPPVVVMGPVQELRMSLEDYGRLATTPAQRIAKIKEKIAILEKQEYAKRLEGVAAWKNSEVFALYVLLGQESVLSGTSIEDTITKRKADGKPSFSVEDFQALTQLNKELRN